jgi:hypothetical protein
MGRRRTNEMILSLFTGIYFIQRVALPEYYLVFTMEAITTLGCLYKDPNIGNEPLSQQCTFLEAQTNLVPVSYDFSNLFK